MSDLDYLLTLLPDNTDGAITAEHMREIITALWNDTDAAATLANALDDRVAALELSVSNLYSQFQALELRVTALDGGAPS